MRKFSPTKYPTDIQRAAGAALAVGSGLSPLPVYVLYGKKEWARIAVRAHSGSDHEGVSSMAVTSLLSDDDRGKPFIISGLGQTFSVKGQKHVVIETRSARRKDGTEAQIAVLESKCSVCGKKFTYSRAMAGEAFWPNRRCDKHKAPGRPVHTVPNTAPAKARDKLRAARAELLEARRVIARHEKRVEDLERALARYELTPGEASVFGERCAAATKERRARVKKLRAMRAPAPSPFG